MTRRTLITNRSYLNATPPKLPVERAFLFRPETEWTYSHHPHLTFFDGRFAAIWSNGFVDEDAPGQRVLISTSTNFFDWTPPQVLAESPGLILTAAGFHAFDGQLVAYFGQYDDARTRTQLFAVTSFDGLHWSARLDLGVPVNPNFGPQATQSGRLIICGNFLLPFTDDPHGLTDWRMAGFDNGAAGVAEDNPGTFWNVAHALDLPAALCEGSFFQTDDGVIRVPLRAAGNGWRGRLWLTESRDDGVTYSFPVQTDFSDNDTKFHFGRLPDGRFYYVGCPDTHNRGARTPLVFSLSDDGVNFSRHFLLADDDYPMQKPGRWKNGQFGYPQTGVFDGKFYVIISRQKEGVEVLRFGLEQFSG